MSDTAPTTSHEALKPHYDIALTEMASEVPDNGSGDEQDMSKQLAHESSETIQETLSKDLKRDASKNEVKEPNDVSAEEKLQQQLSKATGRQQSPMVLQHISVEESKKESTSTGDNSSKESEPQESSQISSATNAEIDKQVKQLSTGKVPVSNDDDNSNELEKQKSPEATDETQTAAAQPAHATEAEPVSAVTKTPAVQEFTSVQVAQGSFNEEKPLQQNSASDTQPSNPPAKAILQTLLLSGRKSTTATAELKPIQEPVKGDSGHGRQVLPNILPGTVNPTGGGILNPGQQIVIGEKSHPVQTLKPIVIGGIGLTPAQQGNPGHVQRVNIGEQSVPDTVKIIGEQSVSDTVKIIGSGGAKPAYQVIAGKSGQVQQVLVGGISVPFKMLSERTESGKKIFRLTLDNATDEQASGSEQTMSRIGQPVHIKQASGSAQTTSGIGQLVHIKSASEIAKQNPSEGGGTFGVLKHLLNSKEVVTDMRETSVNVNQLIHVPKEETSKRVQPSFSGNVMSEGGAFGVLKHFANISKDVATSSAGKTASVVVEQTILGKGKSASEKPIVTGEGGLRTSTSTTAKASTSTMTQTTTEERIPERIQQILENANKLMESDVTSYQNNCEGSTGKPVRVCRVKNCPNNSNNCPDLKFYKFPDEKSRFVTWAERIGRPEYIPLWREGKKFSGKRLVCRLHFEERYIGTSRLRMSAVPTKFLPGIDAIENTNPGLIGGEDVQPQSLSNLEEERREADANDPVVLSLLKDRTEEYLRPVKLQCLLTKDINEVAWYHNGERIQPCEHIIPNFDVKSAAVRKNLDAVFKVGVATLQIPNPSVLYSGLYMCQANGNGKSVVSCSYLSVIGTGDISRAPPIKCRKCSLQLIPRDKTKPLLDDVLPKMKKDMLRHSKSLQPTYMDTPNWMMKLEDTKIRLGKSLILTCMYDDPEASGTWYRNGKRLAVCRHCHIILSTTTTSRYAVIRIKPVTEDDFGTYTCVAISKKQYATSTSCIVSCQDEDEDSGEGSKQLNADDPKVAGECTKCTIAIEPPKSRLVHDEVFQQLQIDIAEMPELSGKKKEAPKFLQKLSDVTVKYGKHFILSAMVDDPHTTISWYHDGKALKTCKGKHTEIVLLTNSRSKCSVLRIIPAMSGDAGKYTCVAIGSFSEKGSISTCHVKIEGTDKSVLEEYKDKSCHKCPKAPSTPVLMKVIEEQPTEQKLPTIQSVWSLSSPAKGQFSTPTQNGETSLSRKRKADVDDLPPPPDTPTRKWKSDDDDYLPPPDTPPRKWKADDNVYPPPPDTPPRSPSPPLPTHDKHVKPIFVQKLTDCHCKASQYESSTGSVLCACIVNVHSAKHEWYHNGKKLEPCKDVIIKRAMDKKAKNGNRMIAILCLRQLSHNDDGVYTCVATNEAGSISTSCFVGDNRTADCVARFPILECEKCKQEKKDVKSETKQTSDVSKESGNKESVISTAEQTAESQGNKPLIVTKDLTGVKDVGSKMVTLQCRFSRSLPSITWLYLGHRIEECSHYTPKEEVVDGEMRASLKMSSLTPVDMGIYTCVAYTKHDPFVSTSCNLTVKSRPMNEYLKVCQKCISRKVERATQYDKMRKNQLKLEEERQQREQGNSTSTKGGASPAKRPKTSLADTSQEAPMDDDSVIMLTSGDSESPVLKKEIKKGIKKEPKQTDDRLKRILAQMRENTAVTKREQYLWRQKNDLTRKLGNAQKKLLRRTATFTKQLKGVTRNRMRSNRATQTIKRKDAETDMLKLKKRNDELVRKMKLMGSRFCDASKEVDEKRKMYKDKEKDHNNKLEETMKELEVKHEAAISELKRKNDELLAELQRRESSQSGRQSHNRGGDVVAFTEFLQYVAPPSQQH